jgi:hypothetical protein
MKVAIQGPERSFPTFYMYIMPRFRGDVTIKVWDLDYQLDLLDSCNS